MKIVDDSVVSFHYRLSEPGGEALEDSYTGEPLSILYGRGNVIAGLERALSGRSEGDKFDVTLEPHEAYGAPKPDAQQRISKKAVITKGKIAKGQIVSVKTDRGPRQATVLKVGRHMVDIDTNHPLAGRTLTFEVEIVDVRQATGEELAHGHSHGPGGHHHH